MRFRLLFFIVLLLAGLYSSGQNRIAGVYNGKGGYFRATDPNVLTQPFVGNRAAFMIKGKDPINDTSNRVGFIDTTGRIVIKARFMNCSNFRGAFALVLDSSRRMGLISRRGRFIIPLRRQEIELCANELFFIDDYSKRNVQAISFVDEKNRTIVPPGRYQKAPRPPNMPMSGLMEGEEGDDSPRGFEWYNIPWDILPFKNYIGVKKDGKWAVIDRTGKEIIAPKYDWIGIFKNGLAPFRLNKKYGVIDSTGKEKITATYDNLELNGDNFVVAIQEGKWGVLSTIGQLLVPFKYDLIKPISSTIFKVYLGDYKKGEAKCGLVTIGGGVLIPLENRYIVPFGNGYLVSKEYNSTALFDSAGIKKTAYVSGWLVNARVWDMGNGNGCMIYRNLAGSFTHYDMIDNLLYCRDQKWGLLDSSLTEITPPRYEQASYLPRVNFIEVEEQKKWGIIDQKGKMLLPCVCDHMSDIRPVLPQLLIVEIDGECGLIDDKMRHLTPMKYDQISIRNFILTHYGNSPTPGFVVAIDDKYGYLGADGKEIIPVKYDEVGEFYGGVSHVRIGNKRGLYSPNGTEIAPCIYDEINEVGLPFFIVKQNDRYGLMDSSGKIIKPAVYQSITTTQLQGGFYYKLQGEDGQSILIDATGKDYVPNNK